MRYLANAFSLGMLKSDAVLRVRRITREEVKELLVGEFKSVIGHEATAQVLERMLGMPVAFNREAISLEAGDIVVVFQLRTRLPEGAVLTDEQIAELPADFFVVEVE